ncbi:MAG: hypothetical protein KIB43_07990 [Clostridium baratii]|uniref:hypothetical protein n=1 Tax=Clostridium baratii TaxID=1561 RepID=UPI00242C15D8|nr:hypothetical protein [Clostridium baratii]MBS6006889.1 hypothetical protein [Clostridium baratii]
MFKKIMKYAKVLGIILTIISIVITASAIWFMLSKGFEKGAEDSWTIGVGLFGSLAGGICTLLAVILGNNQTKKIQNENTLFTIKQFELTILNDKIKEYKNIKEQLLNIRNSIEMYQYLNIDKIKDFDKLVNDVKNISYKVSKFITDINCIEDEIQRRFLDEAAYKLNNGLMELEGGSYIGDEIYNKNKFKDSIEEFIKGTESTISNVIDTEIYRFYNEKYNLLNDTK